jgi:hypothetical protein
MASTTNLTFRFLFLKKLVMIRAKQVWIRQKFQSFCFHDSFIYAHLSKYNVKRGKKVKRGDLIGYVGSTGRSQAPHLHYEVRYNKQQVNPINFYYGDLSPKEFQDMLKMASQEGQSLD